MSSAICVIDDKHVPLYRVVWISDLPHYCGGDDCQCEGLYEIRLEQGEALWGSREDRDKLIGLLEQWCSGADEDGPWEP